MDSRNGHQRIYVHSSLYDSFVAKYAEIVKVYVPKTVFTIGKWLTATQGYKLGDPTEKATNLGPVVSVASATRIKKQVADAVKAGAKTLIPSDLWPIAKDGTAFVAPQVLVDVNHSQST